MGELLQHAAAAPVVGRCHPGEPLPRRRRPTAAPTDSAGRAQRGAVGQPKGGQQWTRERRLPAGQCRQTLRRERLRCARHGRSASVLGGQRAAQDRGSHQQRKCSQAARRRHGAPEEIDSVKVRHINRTSFTTHHPKVDTRAPTCSVTESQRVSMGCLESQVVDLSLSAIDG
jgi:hypothetical protein